MPSRSYWGEPLESRRLLTGPDLAWSSYLGGAEGDYGLGIAIDGAGNEWTAGYTRTGGWAVSGFDTSYNGGSTDAFIAKINADGTLAWSSPAGGSYGYYGFVRSQAAALLAARFSSVHLAADTLVDRSADLDETVLRNDIQGSVT